MRLIDADEFSEQIGYLGLNYDDRQRIRERLNDTPTVDAVEQKHGHWDRSNSDYDCSNCGNSLSDIMDADSYYAIGFEGVPYCPYCGSKMDEKGE